MLKMSGSGMPGTTPHEKNWKNRRSQKLDKMELLNLQSNLQSEIQANQDISQELSKVRAELEASRKDMIKYKDFVEPYSREILRKEPQIKELQGCIETGDGLPCEGLLLWRKPPDPPQQVREQTSRGYGQVLHRRDGPCHRLDPQPQICPQKYQTRQCSS